MLHAKTVVKRVAEAMRPMKKRQTTKNKQVDPNRGEPHQRHQMLVARRLNKSQRNASLDCFAIPYPKGFVIVTPARTRRPIPGSTSHNWAPPPRTQAHAFRLIAPAWHWARD